MRHFRLILLVLLVMVSILGMAACHSTETPGDGTHNTDIETTTPSSETKTEADLMIRYHISEKKDLFIPLYDWYRAKQRSFDGRGLVYWNNTVARKLNANWICAFPSGKYKTVDRGAPGAFLLDIDRIIEYTAKGLEESHEFGIKVMTSAPISEVFPETWKDWGIDADLVRAVNPNGTLSTTYSSGVSHACTFIPMFREMLTTYTEKVAKAGFDGCLYDGNSFGCEPGFYCCCDSCKESWKAFSKEKLGYEAPLPKTAVDLDGSEVGRAFLIWRMHEFSGLLVSLREAGRQYNPDFEVYLNCQNFDLANTYYYLNGLDVITSEYGTKMDLGNESTLFMFAHNEAMTDKQLITFIQKFTDQFDNLNEYYVTMAESYAAGGALCAAEVIRSQPMDYYVNDVGIRFGEMISEHEKAFASSGNIAEVGIVYSWQNGAFHQMKTLPTFPEANYSYPREEFNVNASRQAASVMARKGIPFGYVVVETKPTYEDICRYSTLILNDIDILDKDFEEVLHTFVSNGGNLILGGTAFATRYPQNNGIEQIDREEDLLKAWTGTAYRDTDNYQVLSCGEGKIVVCKRMLRGSSELGSMIQEDFLKAIAELSLTDLVRIEEGPQMGYLESTLRANACGTELYLHLIHINANYPYPTAERYTVSVELPEGATLTDCTAASPFCEKDTDIDLTWSVKDGRVTLTGAFHLYSMLTLHLTYAD
ncbi:MAG: hypothetical protein E7618_06730 [Ruminococcaceae bacterium]|nr:hypothetical protein [Oscillospiraceae bacterium]